MQNYKYSGAVCLFMSMVLCVSILLSILVMPDWARAGRPVWVALSLIYFGLNVPEFKGFGLAWSLGLLLDILYGSLLGMHSLALVVITYMVFRLRRQLRTQPIWQQMVWVFGIVLIYEGILISVNGITGKPIIPRLFILPALTSAMVWPLFLVVFDTWNRRLKHTSVVLR